MLDLSTIQGLPVEIGPRSSVFEVTTPELRRKLDFPHSDRSLPGAAGIPHSPNHRIRGRTRLASDALG
jgi:hypothetical protein